MIDVSKIKSKEIREALDEFNEAEGEFRLVYYSSNIEESFIEELNYVLHELKGIKRLHIQNESKQKLNGIKFSEIESNAIEFGLMEGIEIDESDFSDFIKKQKKLNHLTILKSDVPNLSFLDYANKNLKEVYFNESDLKDTSMEDIFKNWLKIYDIKLIECNGKYRNEECNKFVRECLNGSVENGRTTFLSILPDEVKAFLKGKNNIVLTVEEYLLLNKYIDLNDGIQRKITISDELINDNYIDLIKQIKTNENLILLLNREQLNKVGDKLDKDTYVQVTYERLNEIEDIKKFPECVKSIRQSWDSLSIKKEELNELVTNEQYLKLSVDKINLRIKNASELSIEELDKYEELGIKINSITFEDNNITDLQKEPYTLEQYRACRVMIDEILDGIDLEKENDPNREKKIFGQAIKRLANHMSYDYSALETEEEQKIINASNAYGALVEGLAVCAGMSDACRITFPCANIETKIVTGLSEEPWIYNGKEYYGHAWNQIKLDGVWYNFDLTWDRDDIVEGKNPQFLLKSDKDFGHEKYKINPDETKVEECTHTVNEEELNKYIYGNKNKILGIKDNIETATKRVIANVKSKLSLLWNKFSIGDSDIREAYKILEKTKKFFVIKNMERKNKEVNEDIDDK